jgi:hypothetical protein
VICSFTPTRIVFIDETDANTKMARFYGRRGRAMPPAVLMALGKPPPSPPGCVTTGVGLQVLNNR